MIEVTGARFPLTFDDLRTLCIENSWFTNGDNEQFEKLYNMIHEGANIDEVALVIWICSDEKSRKYIRTMLEAKAMKRGAMA